jgi:hypothetical protein
MPINSEDSNVKEVTVSQSSRATARMSPDQHIEQWEFDWNNLNVRKMEIERNLSSYATHVFSREQAKIMARRQPEWENIRDWRAKREELASAKDKLMTEYRDVNKSLAILRSKITASRSLMLRDAKEKGKPPVDPSPLTIIAGEILDNIKRLAEDIREIKEQIAANEVINR